MKRIITLALSLFLISWPSHSHAFSTATLRDDFNRSDEDPVSNSGAWNGKIISTDPNHLTVTSNQLVRSTTSVGAGSAYFNTQFGPDTLVSLDLLDATSTGNNFIDLWLRVANPGVAGQTDGYLCRFFPNATSGTRVELLRSDNSSRSVQDGLKRYL